MMRRGVKGRLSVFVVVIMLLVAIGPAAYAAKPGSNTSVYITNADFSVTLSQGESYQFEVVARYGSSKEPLDWDDNSTKLKIISGPKVAGIQEKAIYEYIAGDSSEAAIITVTDSNNNTDSLLVDFIVEGGTTENNPPTVEDLFLTTDEDTSVTGNLDAYDPDDDPLTTEVTRIPLNGIASIDGLAVNYDPNENYNGNDSFEVTVSDGNGGSATATVSVTINPVDDPPVAVDDSASTNMNTPVDINVMDNDTDIDGGDMYIASVSDASNGVAAIIDEDKDDKGDLVRFTPTDGYTGTEAGFTYTLNGGSSATVTVTVNETGGDPPPEEPLKYVALGDSIPSGTYYRSLWDYLGGGTDTYSYVEQFADYLNVESGNFIDASISGNNTVDVFNQIDQMSATISEADVITLCVGANDIMDAASRGWSGLNKYDIDWNVADQGRANFELYWPQVIDGIEELNPDVTLIVMTIYNPYRITDDYYDLVDPYFSGDQGDFGLNHIIEFTMDLDNSGSLWAKDLIADNFNYNVVDIYDAFNSNPDKDSLTGFYDSFCDPHPNQSGQNFIFEEHVDVFGAIQ